MNFDKESKDPSGKSPRVETYDRGRTLFAVSLSFARTIGHILPKTGYQTVHKTRCMFVCIELLAQAYALGILPSRGLRGSSDFLRVWVFVFVRVTSNGLG